MLSDTQLNEVTKSIAKNIPTDCSAYEDRRNKSNNYNAILGKTTFNLSSYEAYRNDIEFVNSFNEQLLIDEKKYLEEKYGPKVYAFLLSQRQSFKEQQTKLKEDLMCRSFKQALAELQKSYNEKEDCKPQETKTNSDSGKFMSFLMSQNTIQNPETTYKKIEYRNEAHELLSTINHWMTVFYFVILIVMLALLAASSKLLLKERFILYLFLLVLPFVFPYLFQLLKYLYGYIFPDSSSHGPKDAFLDTKTELVDSFNV